jgi:hypothetical protein
MCGPGTLLINGKCVAPQQKRDDGCGCRTVGENGRFDAMLTAGTLLGLVAFRRRRRRRDMP